MTFPQKSNSFRTLTLIAAPGCIPREATDIDARIKGARPMRISLAVPIDKAFRDSVMPGSELVQRKPIKAPVVKPKPAPRAVKRQ